MLNQKRTLILFSSSEIGGAEKTLSRLTKLWRRKMSFIWDH